MSGQLPKLLKLNRSFNNEWHLHNGGKLYIWWKKMEGVCERKDPSRHLYDTTVFIARHLYPNQLCPIVNPTCFDMRSKLVVRNTLTSPSKLSQKHHQKTFGDSMF